MANICKIYVPSNILASTLAISDTRYIGTCSETLTNGSITNPVSIIGQDAHKHTSQTGDVVIDRSNHSDAHIFLWSSNKWNDKGVMYEVLTFKDDSLRDGLDTLKTCGTKFIGIITDTDMKDGSTKTTVTLKSGGTHTAEVSDVVITDNTKEMFLYTNANVWNLMGSTFGLGALAYADEAEGTLTVPNNLEASANIKYDKTSSILFNMPKEEDYSFSTDTIDIPVEWGEIIDPEVDPPVEAHATLTYNTLASRVNFVNLSGKATMTTTPTKIDAFVSAPMVMQSTDALSNLDNISYYEDLKKTNNLTTLLTTSSETASKAPTYTTPSQGTDLALSHNEALPSLYGEYVEHAETDPLSGETTCGELVFTWDPGYLLEVQTGTGTATTVNLPAAGEYTPVDIPDTTTSEVLSSTGTSLGENLLQTVEDGQSASVPASIGTYVTQSVINGFASPATTVSLLNNDPTRQVIIGEYYTDLPNQTYVIDDYFEANVEIPAGITVANNGAGTGVYSITNGKVSQTTTPTDMTGGVSITMDGVAHTVTVTPKN